MGMRDVRYSSDARKTLRRLPANIARLIEAKLQQYSTAPASLRNKVRRLKGEGNYMRLRVGDWRVIFTEDGTVVAVIRIAPRGNAYD